MEREGGREGGRGGERKREREREKKYEELGTLGHQMIKRRERREKKQTIHDIWFWRNT